MQLFNVTGIMISYFVNYGISKRITDASNSAQWRIPFALQMLPGLLLLLVVFQNESPRWLVEKNHLIKARQALSHIRNLPEDDAAIQEELDEIVADFEGKERLSLGMQARAACSSKKAFYQASLGVVLMFWQQFTGTNSINYYSPWGFPCLLNKYLPVAGTDFALQTNLRKRGSVEFLGWVIRHGYLWCCQSRLYFDGSDVWR